MSSLYQIQADIVNLFNQIEEQDGEITEEQAKLLEITQEELNVKLNNYNKAIISWNADIVACKEEEKRINTVRKKHENRIKRLKEAMLLAVSTFGEDGKSGNKFIELPTVKLFTKSTPCVETNQERIDTLVFAFIDYIKYLVNNDCLYAKENVDLNTILDAINTRIIIDKGGDYKLFTLADLTTLKIDFITHMSIYEYFRKGEELIKYFVTNPFDVKIIDNTPKEDWKIAQEIGEENNTSVPTIAYKNKTTSIQIR